MTTRLLAGIVVAAALTRAPNLVAADHAVCSDLTKLKLPDVNVTEATRTFATSCLRFVCVHPSLGEIAAGVGARLAGYVVQPHRQS